LKGAQTKRSRGRPGGGSEAIIHAILEATLAELGRGGYARLSVEEIARRSGVNKTSVYRRWPTKGELVRAALSSLRPRDRAAPDTGALRTDLLELLRRTVAKLSSPRGKSIIRLLMAEGDAELGALARKMREKQHAEDAVVFERAVARGELPRRTDTSLLLELLTAPVLRRLFIAHARVDDEYMARVVDVFLHGVVTPRRRPRGAAHPGRKDR
jgi:AcrR family transcriptional regulator